MDHTVPPGAALLLDVIAGFEAPKGYATVYANKMAFMPKALTAMTLGEVIAQGAWRTKAFGSSACGRYQFMTATLIGLRDELKLDPAQAFSPDLQDRLGYHLLKRRGYAPFMAGALDRAGFGLGVAKEWASFPVLAPCRGQKRQVARGQSFYAGDGLNKALVKPEAVEAALDRAKAAGGVSSPPTAASSPPKVTAQPAPTGGLSSAPSTAVVSTPAAPAPSRTFLQRIADRLRVGFPRSA